MKTKTYRMVTTPSQIFEQGQIGEEEFEQPIQFIGYNGSIGLWQEGREIILNEESIEPFIKSLRSFNKTYKMFLK